ATEAGAVCVDMESGAIAQVACINQVEFLAVRTISDSADGDAPASFSDFCEESARRAEEWLREFILHV
ncbi:MAG: 5'-methylthioadenosine/adenosylhomocysteine nucleosidase, partial [Clostridia bacterium]|nr:5'-methylthioadenosine/adenosylhomocysteine nucleosidase [Clostridia bacterium]